MKDAEERLSNAVERMRPEAVVQSAQGKVDLYTSGLADLSDMKTHLGKVALHHKAFAEDVNERLVWQDVALIHLHNGKIQRRPIKGTKEITKPCEGMQVSRTGPNGTSQGIIQAFPVEHRFTAEIEGKTITKMICSYAALHLEAEENFSEGGDSGSLIIESSSSAAVGLLFEGQVEASGRRDITYFAAMDDVLEICKDHGFDVQLA